MYLNDFSARVPEGKELPGGYVELEHDTQYTLNLRNNRNVRSRAEVYVDGKHVGTFRLKAHGTLRLERPAHDDGKFTFYRLGTSEASDAGLLDGPDIGLIRVVFTPELVQTWTYNSPWYPYNPWTPWKPPWRPQPYWTDWTGNSGITQTMNVSQTRQACSAPTNMKSGGTGLSGQSDQSFVTVPDLNLDTAQQTTIHLRLVCKGDDGPRPLTAFSTPVPPKV